VEVTRVLLDSDIDKKTIVEKDNDGQLPIHCACDAEAPLEVLQLLLQGSVCHRIERLGLEQWNWRWRNL
jgi:hypothetical protein